MCVLWLLGGVVGMLLVFDLACRLTDRLWPLKYRCESLSELREHVEQFFRRALRRTQLVVKAEGTGNSVRILKWYDYSDSRTWAYVVVPDVERFRRGSNRAREVLSKVGGECGFGVSPRRLWDADLLACRCEDVDAILSAVHQVFHELHGLPETTHFVAYVKGSIAYDDVLWHGRSSARDSLVAARSRKLARPYLRSGALPVRAVMYALGSLLGKIIFFPSRLARWLGGRKGPPGYWDERER